MTTTTESDLTSALNDAIGRHRRAVGRQTKAVADDIKILAGRLQTGEASSSDVRAVLCTLALLVERMAGLEAVEDVSRPVPISYAIGDPVWIKEEQYSPVYAASVEGIDDHYLWATSVLPLPGDSRHGQWKIARQSVPAMVSPRKLEV